MQASRILRYALSVMIVGIAIIALTPHPDTQIIDPSVWEQMYYDGVFPGGYP